LNLTKVKQSRVEPLRSPTDGVTSTASCSAGRLMAQRSASCPGTSPGGAPRRRRATLRRCS